MNPLFTELRARIPANKFYPPRLDPAQYLFRKRLVEEILEGKGRGRRIILIEAQAGQGKTTLAAQVLERAKAPFAWYQVGSEDGDPVLLLTALLACLMNAMPGFRSPLLEEMIPKGEVSPLELPRYANLLLADLDRHLKRDLWLVLDDLHLLEGAEASVALLGHILQTAPPKLRFLLAARRPVELELPVLKRGREPLLVGNRELALSRAETGKLFCEILHLPISGSQVKKLHEATEGWPMGLVLAAHASERKTGGLFTGADMAKDDLLDYFQSEIFSQIPTALRRTLLKLAWLDQIPVPLAEQFSEVPDIGSKLAELSRKNFFVRSLDERNLVFRFHHLFQEFLQGQAPRELHQEEINEALVQAAVFCLEQKRPEGAMGYYLKAGDYEALERVFEKEGLALYAMNRVAALTALLQNIPEEIIRQHGWLSYFFGVTRMDTDPPRAHSYLEGARTLFAKGKNALGELLATAQLITYHWIVDGRHNQGSPLLPRAEKLLSMLADELDLHTRLQVASAIAYGYCFFEADMPRAGQHSSVALRLAEENDLDNFVAGAAVARGFQHGMEGNWEAFRRVIERSHSLLKSLRVSAINKLTLSTMQVNLLEMEGDFTNYQHQKALLKTAIEKDLVAKSVVGPFLWIWDMDSAIARDCLDDGLDFVREGLEGGIADGRPHLLSQFLHYAAFLLALRGEAEEAVEAAEKSMQLRAEAGGKFFEVLNSMIIGATYAQLGMTELAEEFLGRAIEDSCIPDEEILQAAARSHRGYLRLIQGRIGEALTDIRECLRCLGKNHYVHFFNWTPRVMRPLLETAVAHGIEADYAQKLANERLGIAILPGGEAIPLLKIRALGALALDLDGAASLTVSDLTPAQRELLALLITAPNGCLSQEAIQAALWPESSQKKARSGFDNLVSRVRKVMDEAFAPHAARNYLVLEKGILSLRNCRIDAVEFVEKARTGQRHAKRKEFWQAGNAFYSAHRLWQGEFMPGVQSGDAVGSFREELTQLFLQSAQSWSEILAANGQEAEAVRVAEEAVRVEGTNEPLVRLLYNLHSGKGDVVRARQVVRRYEEALRREDYSTEEIEEILESFWTAPA